MPARAATDNATALGLSVFMASSSTKKFPNPKGCAEQS